MTRSKLSDILLELGFKKVEFGPFPVLAGQYTSEFITFGTWEEIEHDTDQRVYSIKAFDETGYCWLLIQSEPVDLEGLGFTLALCCVLMNGDEDDECSEELEAHEEGFESLNPNDQTVH